MRHNSSCYRTVTQIKEGNCVFDLIGCELLLQCFTHSYTHTHSQKQSHTHIHTHTHTHVCMHTHTHTHTHMHTHKQTQTHTHIHTHTLIHYIDAIQKTVLHSSLEIFGIVSKEQTQTSFVQVLQTSVLCITETAWLSSLCLPQQMQARKAKILLLEPLLFLVPKLDLWG